MRKGLKKFLVGFLALACIGVMQAPSLGVGASDATPDTIEPILVKAEAQVNNPLFRTPNLGAANITAVDLVASGGNIIATVTTKAPIYRCVAAPCSIPQPPYGGVHINVLFKTSRMNQYEPTGCGSTTSTPNPSDPRGAGYCSPLTRVWIPENPDDNNYWWLYYASTISEQREDYGLGLYDPRGQLLGYPLEPGVGQTFGTFAQKHSLCPGNLPGDGDLPPNTSNNISVSFPAPNQVRLVLPYVFQWRLALTNATFPCGAQSKRVIAANESIYDIVGFSWMDHEIGGPEPVGLIFGWTWYTDSVPALMSGSGYKVGTTAGDPNPSRFSGPNCHAFLLGENRNPLYNGGACTTANPIGPGFTSSGLSTIAS